MRLILSLALAAGLAMPAVSAEPVIPVIDPVSAVQDALSGMAEDLASVQETVRRLEERWHWLHDPRTMPAYYQTDAAWSALPYAYGTVASSGCGLTAAAMAVSWWARDEVTPAELRDRYGDSCTIGGLNDMQRFRDRVCADYGLAGSERYWSIEQAVSDAEAGKTVWCSVSGRFGDGWYGGHIVLLWHDGASLRVSDPANHANTRAWRAEELLAQGCWKYFYSIWMEGAI